MYELLYKKISEVVSITPAEFDYCKTLFVAKKLRKKQYFLQEGDVCQYQAFVAKGILRSYTVDDKGAKHILQFASEGWWMADLYSFFTGEPSGYNMDAIEEAELLLITRPSWELLMQKLPRMEHYFRILLQNHLIATQRRLMQSLRGSAEENYRKFAATYPDCVQRVPQHMVASYLGITRETLSRLRRQMASATPR